MYGDRLLLGTNRNDKRGIVLIRFGVIRFDLVRFGVFGFIIIRLGIVRLSNVRRQLGGGKNGPGLLPDRRPGEP